MANRLRVSAFTGTRTGMSEAQLAGVRALLIELKITHLAHGAAYGADEQVSLIAKDLGLQVKAYPGDVASEQSAQAYAVRSAAPTTPLKRNKAMVDGSHLLIAAPDGPERRGGTWTTIRYALSKNKQVKIVMPDGTTTEEVASP